MKIQAPTANQIKSFVIAAAPVLLLMAFFILCANWGIDFGTHWDEANFIDHTVINLERGNLLPGWYDYPSLPSNMVYLAFTRKVISYTLANFPSGVSALPEYWQNLSAYLLTTNFSGFYLSVRKIFILFSALSVLWVYLLVYKWRRSLIEAALAAALLVGSWEFLYHSRWIAPDIMVAMFGIASLACLYFALEGTRWNLWIQLAAIAAGLTLASKYPGGLILVPLLAACLLNKQANRLESFLKVLGLFFLTFYVVSPGVFWDLTRSLTDITKDFVHYTYAGHRGYSVLPGIEGIRLWFTYLFAVAFSHNIAISLFFSAFFLVGLYQVAREKRLFGLLMILFFVVYMAYFNTVRAMTVRNVMIVLPVMAILMARGMLWVYHQIPLKAGRVFYAVVLIGCFVYNFAWQAYAANSIRTGGGDRAQAVDQYIRQHPDQTYWLSENVTHMLQLKLPSLPTNITPLKEEADLFILNTDDVGLKSITYWLANRIDYTVAVIGPYEMNFNYYPSWSGRSRVVVMRPAYVLPLMQYIEAPNP